MFVYIHPAPHSLGQVCLCLALHQAAVSGTDQSMPDQSYTCIQRHAMAAKAHAMYPQQWRYNYNLELYSHS